MRWFRVVIDGIQRKKLIKLMMLSAPNDALVQMLDTDNFTLGKIKMRTS